MINDTEGKMANYIVLNDTRKRGRSVSRNFKTNQFYEKENKPNSMKFGYKTNRVLTATAVRKLIIPSLPPKEKL